MKALVVTELGTVPELRDVPEPVRGTGEALIELLAASISDALPAVEVRLVVGPWCTGDIPVGVVPVIAPCGLADELAAAPIVVTAGGVSMLESCLLGRATVAVVLAESQRRAVASLAHEGAVVAATLTLGACGGHDMSSMSGTEGSDSSPFVEQ